MRVAFFHDGFVVDGLLHVAHGELRGRFAAFRLQRVGVALLGRCGVAGVGEARAQLLPSVGARALRDRAMQELLRLRPLPLLAGQPSILLRREITVSAALLAATVFVAARALGLEAWPAALIAAPCGFALRAGALVWGWSLPAFPGTPTRS